MSATNQTPALVPAFARCRVASLEAAEEYVYRFRLDPLPSPEPLEPGEGAVGVVEVALPLDGTKCVSGELVEDVRHQRRGEPTLDHLRLGHLLFWNTGGADFGGEVVAKRDQASVPLQLNREKVPANLSRLAANRETVVFQQAYVPSQPTILPVTIRVSVADEDSLPSDSLAAENVKWLAGGAFRSELALRLQFRVNLPRPVPDDLKAPVLSGFQLTWPTLPCLSSLRLLDGAGREQPLSYDPWSGSLSSAARVPLRAETAGDSPVQPFSGELILLVASPSDLYLADELVLSARVEVEGVLISRLGAAVSDATGVIRIGAAAAKTRLALHARLVLAPMLELRKCAPAQRWVFPDVVPNQENCEAIAGRLLSRAFVVDSAMLSDAARKEWLLLARGPEITPVDMLVRVHGVQIEVTVHTTLPNGEKVISTRHTGTTEIEVRAWPKPVAESDPGMRVRINEVLAEIHRDLRNTLISRQTQ